MLMTSGQKQTTSLNPLVLVAEGDTHLSDLFRGFLLMQGYQVEMASGGLECVEKLRRFQPDVLVLDQDLLWGGCDGVMAWLNDEYPHSRVAVVLTDKTSFSSQNAPGSMVAMPSFALTALEDSVCRGLAFRRKCLASNKG